MHTTSNQIREAIVNAASGMTEEQMRRHAEGKWDTAAILEHLALTYSSTVRVMQKCLQEEGPPATPTLLKQWVAQAFVLWFSYIPHGGKAPKQVVPSGLGGREALDLLLSNLEKMDQSLAQCEERFGQTIKIAHAVLGPIRIAAWRKFHILHTLHHMKQIEALKNSAERFAVANG